jgi:hypothetical protein
LPIFARLHHVTGVIDGKTHVVKDAETHILHGHEARFALADGTIKKYSLRAGHPPVEILPEHRQYFETLRDRDTSGPLACEVYEADQPRPVPEAPQKRHGAITASDLSETNERLASAEAKAQASEARASAAEAKAAGLEANVNRLAGMMETLLARQPAPAGAGTPPAAPAAPSAPLAAAPPVPLTRDGIPAAFPADPVAPVVAVPPAAKEPELTQAQQHREPPQKPESDAAVMARTAHETATKAGFRDKRPKVSP